MSKSFTEHRDFVRVSQVASAAMMAAAESLGCAPQLDNVAIEARVNRVADALTRILLHASDAHPTPLEARE
jgi:hypothetical protein